ncbi:hypothetical protein E3N88_14231 [Mikania micrantha]|uniref:Uncharacterized protein n=1 Tax=Mikania micrantha TaxID=192012 RepID=A0A5N6P2J8_9ASTR|nr:hypothetical protein E3N88_14231 [Mikania micrantha]
MEDPFRRHCDELAAKMEVNFDRVGKQILKTWNSLIKTTTSVLEETWKIDGNEIEDKEQVIEVVVSQHVRFELHLGSFNLLELVMSDFICHIWPWGMASSILNLWIVNDVIKMFNGGIASYVGKTDLHAVE